MSARPLLMIPGPIEVSPAVQEAFCVPPPSHVAGHVIEAFGASLEKMRTVWRAGADSQPFIVAGSGTLAMELGVANLVDPGDRVLVVNTGYFSDRMGLILERLGADVTHVRAEVGEVPHTEAVAEALRSGAPYKLLCATHVDTSTGVRVDAQALAGLAREHGVLSVFDGVCATVGEAFEMEAWGADVYLTGSQKAVGLPPGLGLLVASKRAMDARAQLKRAPSLFADWHQWLPIMQAYEARKPSYFATPATNLILALDVGLSEIVARGPAQVAADHARVAGAVRQAWSALGLQLLPRRAEDAANTLSAVRYPEGVGPALVGEVKARGVIVAGGLYPGLKQAYFRVGHMGYSVTRRDWIAQTVQAVAEGLVAVGYEAADPDAAQAALEQGLG